MAAASKPTPAQEAAEKTLRQQLGIARGDSLGSHPLHSAAANGNVKACLALIEALRPAPEAAADVSARNFFNSTPLHYAAANGRAKVALLTPKRELQQPCGGRKRELSGRDFKEGGEHVGGNL